MFGKPFTGQRAISDASTAKVAGQRVNGKSHTINGFLFAVDASSTSVMLPPKTPQRRLVPAGSCMDGL